MTLITTFIIMAVTSNVVLSLGMVGALSIVRFRTAIKDPLDTVFIFWAISASSLLRTCAVSVETTLKSAITPRYCFSALISASCHKQQCGQC
jgi:hypothetical protein